MSEADAGERTELPTQKKLEDAAKKGDLLASRDLSVALVMVAGTGWLLAGGAWMIGALASSLREGLAIERADIERFDVGATMAEVAAPLALPFTLLFALTLMGAFAAPAMLGSLGFRSSGFAFKGERINPKAGLARMFGLQALLGMGRAGANTLVVGVIGWMLIAAAAKRLLAPIGFDVGGAARAMGNGFVTAAVLLVGGLAVIALADVPIQYAQRMRRLRMTKQEVRDENKQSEGSPEAKANLRQRRHLLLSQSTRKSVAEATVVLTNPTHFAVALRYRPGEDAAPIVVARGRGATALAIRDLARESAVPVLGSPPLTRALYYTSRTGAAVREELYMAVAVVLAFVFRLDAEARAAANAAPDVMLPDGFAYDSDGRVAR